MRSTTPVSVAGAEWEAGAGTGEGEVKRLSAEMQTGVARQATVAAG